MPTNAMSSAAAVCSEKNLAGLACKLNQPGRAEAAATNHSASPELLQPFVVPGDDRCGRKYNPSPTSSRSCGRVWNDSAVLNQIVFLA